MELGTIDLIKKKNDFELALNSELIDAFKKSGLPLNDDLASMLRDDKEIQHERLGNGFAQAGRFLAQIIRNKDDAARKIFSENISGNVDKTKIISILHEIKKPEQQIIVNMIADIFQARPIKKELLELPSFKEKSPVRSCVDAEKYFLEIIERENKDEKEKKDEDPYYRVNVVLDKNNEPLFFQKIVRSQPSALTLKPFYLNGVEIPAGSLVALEYSSELSVSRARKIVPNFGMIIPSSDLKEVDFLRFSTLAIEPKERKRVFGKQFKDQIKNNWKGAETVTINDFIKKAKERSS